LTENLDLRISQRTDRELTWELAKELTENRPRGGRELDRDCWTLLSEEPQSKMKGLLLVLYQQSLSSGTATLQLTPFHLQTHLGMFGCFKKTQTKTKKLLQGVKESQHTKIQ